MPKLIDLTGKPFGQLTVLYRSGTKIYASKTKPVVMWMCECSCGNKKEVASANLRNEDTKSCGDCDYAANLRHAKGRTWAWKHHLNPGQITRNATLQGYKTGAVTRGLDWRISDDLFDQITSRTCFYCGAAPMNKRTTGGDSAPFIYNGIDRKDNSNGYIEGNVVTCCKICNRAKSDLPYNGWIAYLDRIKSYSIALVDDELVPKPVKL